MAKKIDINAELKEYIPVTKETSDSSLCFKLYGESITPSVINALKRTILSEIPIYNCSKATIDIEKNKNTSVYNNDYMRLRLSMMPPPKIKSDFIYLPEDYYPYDSGAYGLIKPNTEPPKHPNDKNNIIAYVNVINDSKDENYIKNVTTNDFKILNNGEEIKNENNNVYNNDNPSLVLKLKQGQEFSAKMQYVLGIAEIHECWAAVAGCFYEKVEPTNYLMTIESTGQLNEFEILEKACKIIVIKLNNIQEFIKANFDEKVYSSVRKVLIKLDNEDGTIGCIINDIIQDHKDVKYAGCMRDHPKKKEIDIEIQTIKENPITIFHESVEYLCKLYEKMEKLFGEMNSEKPKKEIKQTKVKKTKKKAKQ